MKIAVVQNDTNKLGGAEETARQAIYTINENGLKPDVFSFSNYVDNKHDLKLNLISIPGPKKRFALYRGFIKNWYIKKYIKNYDLIFDFSGFLLGSINKEKYIYYVHFPEYILQKYNSKYKSFIGRIYWLPRNLVFDPIQKYFYKKNDKITMFANSEFTADIIYKTLNRNINILYPPVELYDIATNELSEKQQKTVVSLGRFSAEKNQLLQIEIARQLPEYCFYICGAANITGTYYKKVIKKINQYKIKNVYLFPNISKQNLDEILLKSTVFLHTMQFEHFGMSIVQAMSAGCYPVVPNTGGPAYIAKGIGYVYKSMNELIEGIEKANNSSAVDRNKVIERANKFSVDNFRKTIENIIVNYKYYNNS